MTRTEVLDGAAVLRMTGVLNAVTYRQVRDAAIKAALERVTAVIIDVNELEVTDEPAWVVFTSARWHVHQWPDVVIALVSSDPAVHWRLRRLSVSRYVPVFTSVADAVHAIGEGSCKYRRHATTSIAPHEPSTRAVQSFVRDHLMQWSMETKVTAAVTVATIFVENALSHTKHGCDLRLEATDEHVVVAVSDASTAAAIRRESEPGSLPKGLDIVAAICRRWGNSPTSTGKTVWAQIDSDDPINGIARLLH